MTIKDASALSARAKNLGDNNGIELVLVSLRPDPDPTEAVLELHLFNDNQVQEIVGAVQAHPERALTIFPISGGHRVRGGPLAGQVHVTAVAQDASDATVLDLTVQPIGDYSAYRLGLVFEKIDPLFGEVEFKFRPGCFNNCPPEWPAPPAPVADPPIDYLAKDYDSFVHTLVAWMGSRVPGWQPTSEADLDQTLLELFSAAADELSDFQDRVMNEAYLLSARKRVSLARHARLVDYHIHQGNQASTWLALIVNEDTSLDSDLEVWSGRRDDPEAAFFASRLRRADDPGLFGPLPVRRVMNTLGLYTWGDAIPALAAGSTQADLAVPTGHDADEIVALIRAGTVTHLLIQEDLNPLTGQRAGRDRHNRQMLRLLPGDAGAEALKDPVPAGQPEFVRVRWDERDALRQNYCFVADCNGAKVRDISSFHGNLLQVYHGRPQEAEFVDPAQPLDPHMPDRYHYERNAHGEAICRLPGTGLAYRNTPPGGEVEPRSTLEVEIHLDVKVDRWDEVISLVHSDGSDERGDHFVVETDENGHSLIRTGNGVNGRRLPDGALVRCCYQLGRGLAGNVGADVLTHFDRTVFGFIESCTNPFDVTDGRDPEPPAEIIRRAPEAYRFRQLRAITLHDYVRRAEEVPGVARAAARYAWTGSWRTVQITVDPAGTETLSTDLRTAVSQHLEAVRLIGEDLEIRAPAFVPVEITVVLCIHAGYWPQDVRDFLEMEFSDGYTPDGRLAFFHPDRWTFGQPLRASEILGRVQAIEGVDHVVSLAMKRRNTASGGPLDVIKVRANEIIQVRNDPDQRELGSIEFVLEGGRG